MFMLQWYGNGCTLKRAGRYAAREIAFNGRVTIGSWVFLGREIINGMSDTLK